MKDNGKTGRQIEGNSNVYLYKGGLKRKEKKKEKPN